MNQGGRAKRELERVRPDAEKFANEWALQRIDSQFAQAQQQLGE